MSKWVENDVSQVGEWKKSDNMHLKAREVRYCT